MGAACQRWRRETRALLEDERHRSPAGLIDALTVAPFLLAAATGIDLRVPARLRLWRAIATVTTTGYGDVVPVEHDLLELCDRLPALAERIAALMAREPGAGRIS